MLSAVGVALLIIGIVFGISLSTCALVWRRYRISKGASRDTDAVVVIEIGDNLVQPTAPPLHPESAVPLEVQPALLRRPIQEVNDCDGLALNMPLFRSRSLDQSCALQYSTRGIYPSAPNESDLNLSSRHALPRLERNGSSFNSNPLDESQNLNSPELMRPNQRRAFSLTGNMLSMGSMRPQLGLSLPQARLGFYASGSNLFRSGRFGSTSRSVRFSEDDTDKVCQYCLDAPRTILLDPCGHACLCKVCFDLVMAKDATCPICRDIITGFQEGNFLETFVELSRGAALFTASARNSCRKASSLRLDKVAG